MMTPATTIRLSHGTLPPTALVPTSSRIRRVARSRARTAAAATEGRAAESTSKVTEHEEQRGGEGRRRITLKAEELTPSSFAPFGQVVSAEEDGVEFSSADAQLDLSQGTPRFYIMRLRDKDLSFERITFHGRVTQCLGALGDASWYMAVAAPTMDVSAPPRAEDLRAFKVPPGSFIKMHAGTWHAGPLFKSDDTLPFIDFYNLELSDTNQVDHNAWDYGEEEGVTYEVAEA